MERQHHSQVVSSWLPLNTMGSGSGHHLIPQNFTEKKSLNVKFINKYLAKLDFLISIWEILYWLSFYLANFIHTCVWKINIYAPEMYYLFLLHTWSTYCWNLFCLCFWGVFLLLIWFLMHHLPTSGFETSSGVAISLHSWC